MGLERLAPNLASMTPDTQYVVTTEEHELTLEVRRNGPQTKGYFIGFVASDPPITEAIFFPGEIFVKNDVVIIGEVFELSALLPLLSKSAFRAIGIKAV